MLGKNKKRFKNFGISDEEFIKRMKETRFLASHNQAWNVDDPSLFDAVIRNADIHRNDKYVFHHSVCDMNPDNLTLYIGDISQKPTFGHMFKLLMHDAQVTVENLSAKTGISVKAIQRIRNNETDRINLNYLVAVALALHLPYEDSIRLINTAGYSLREYIEIEVIYDLILKNASDLDYVKNGDRVENCNKILERLGCPPLTKTE